MFSRSRTACFAFLLAASLTLSACSFLLPTTTVDAGQGDALEDAPPVEEPTPTPTLTPTVAWQPCEGQDRFECATVPVPLDHDDPDGDTIDIALIRLPAPAAARRIGSLVVNPGGPGASGVEFVREAGIDVMPAEVRARFDIVGFDPRGAGQSRPVTCASASREFIAHDLDPDDGSETSTVLAAAEAFASSCGTASGQLLPHVGTRNVAKDLDAIRLALGDHELTYLGYSYGTRIGAAYAEQFPENVRALVLDGAVDPSLDLVGYVRAEAQTIEDALEEFLSACVEEVRCELSEDQATLGAFDALMADLETRSLPAPYLGPDRRLEPGRASLAVLGFLRNRSTWPMLYAALAMAFAGDGSILAAAFEPVADEAQSLTDDFAPLMAVNCRDVPGPTAQDLPSLAEELETVAPRFGPVSLFLHSPCAFWPVEAEGQARPVTAPGAPPIVVVGNKGDLVTPFAWSESLAAQLESGVLLTRDGDRHTAFGGENVCTDRAVIRYLIDLIPPDPTRACG